MCIRDSGEGVRALMRTDDLAGLVHDVARTRPEALGQETRGVPVGDEADVMAVGLGCHGEATGGGLGANL